jgi:hypothetical protein
MLWGALAAVLVATFAAYLPFFDGEFQYDDQEIAKTLWVREASRFLSPGYWTTMPRPLTAVLFAIDHEIDAFRPRAWHVTNVLIHLASDAISIGPYVLSGGELPAMVLVDAIARRLPGALAEESGAIESFSSELEGGLEYPHYTRPAEFRGWRVPDVLLSGDHRRIDEWRMEQSRLRTGS